MVARLRLTSALGALLAGVVIVLQTAYPTAGGGPNFVLRATGAPPTNVYTSLAPGPALDLTSPEPFNPCTDIPLAVTDGLGLGYTPPEQQDSLRCQYDAGNYQVAVEAFVWRTYDNSLPADAVELDIDGHRAAQYWVMKPTDWNNRWWITCMVAFKTSYGVIQQSLFYSPIYSEPDVDCMQENLMRAHQLAPYYKY
jgi:hypothetical protein